jgi:hypothetical protein
VPGRKGNQLIVFLKLIFCLFDYLVNILFGMGYELGTRKGRHIKK